MKDKLDLLDSFLKAKTKFKPCKMSGRNPFFGNSAYSTLADIKEATDEALAAEGLIAFHTSLDNMITYHIVHVKTGQELISSMPIITKDDTDDESADLKTKPRKRNIIQELGAEITYLRRYTAAPLLGIVADEDVDGNNTAQHKSKQEPEAKQPSPDAKDGKTTLENARASVFARCGELKIPDTFIKKMAQIIFKKESRSQLTFEEWVNFRYLLDQGTSANQKKFIKEYFEQTGKDSKTVIKSFKTENNLDRNFTAQPLTSAESEVFCEYLKGLGNGQ